MDAKPYNLWKMTAVPYGDDDNDEDDYCVLVYWQWCQQNVESTCENEHFYFVSGRPFKYFTILYNVNSN